jgi:hypothetical protein
MKLKRKEMAPMKRNRSRAENTDGPGATSDSTNENSIMISQEGITMTHMRLRKILLVVLLLGSMGLWGSGSSRFFLLTGEVHAQGQSVPVADYGDAPDGLPCGYSEDPAQDQDIVCKFPTLFATTNARVSGRPGAHALTVGQESLGAVELTSTERDANDPNDPDQTPNLTDDDIDDGLRVDFLPTGLIRFKVLVKLAPTASSGPRYLNVLYDRNRDGEWRASSEGEEWIVKNFSVNLAPGGEQEIEIPIPVDQNWILALSQPRWLRLALTREQISEALFVGVGGWDGSGAFSAGEIEDYKIGAVRAFDLAWAARTAFRIRWAWAVAWARAFAAAVAVAEAQAAAVARADAQALAIANAAAAAQAQAQAAASAAANAYAQAQASAAAAATAFASVPCATVRASAWAAVSAQVEAAARAQASAAAAASAAAEASARALAWARAIAAARAEAQAAAAALAAAGARARARAEALASAWADARAWAAALAQALSSGQFPAQASALALAWAQAQAWAFAWADAQASASAWALALAQASAAAAAEARATAAALAIAEAEASARAFAEAAASARASAESSASAIAAAGASINVQTLGECCRTGGFCPVPPPPPTTKVTVTVGAKCAETGQELRGIPIVVEAAGSRQTLPTPFTVQFPQGTVARFTAPPSVENLHFSHWLLHDGRTFTSNPLQATLVSEQIGLWAIYKGCR